MTTPTRPARSRSEGLVPVIIGLVVLLATTPLAYLLALGGLMQFDGCATRDCASPVLQFLGSAVRLSPAIIAGLAVVATIVVQLARRRALWIPYTGAAVMLLVVALLDGTIAAVIANQPYAFR